MLYLSAGILMLGLAVFGDRPRVRDHVVTFGLGLGALLAGLLISVPATGTALATPFAHGSGDSGVVWELVVTQSAWLVTACLGLAGYLLSRPARRLRSPRALTAEAVAVGGVAALLPATTGHLAFVVLLVPLAAAGVIATLLEELERPSVVLAGLLATAAFLLLFTVGRAVPALGLPYLVLGVAGLAFMVGRWTDLHPASISRPSLPLWVSMAGGFLATYKL
jgi:hypothetical protein